MRKILAPAMIALTMGGLIGAARAESTATGTWLMDNGKVTVKVTPCGSNLCGTIIGLKKPLDKKGRPKLDKENPNPSLRLRPVIGLTILSNMKPDGRDKWAGTIYNPDDGYTYRSFMKLRNSDTMKVEGCFSVFCKTLKFVRLK